MRARPRCEAQAVAIIVCKQHLDLLARRDLKKLMAVTGADEALLKEAQALIVACEPKPGRPFTRAEANIVVPDVIVQKAGRGWKVVLNPDVMPKLRINDLYAQAIKGQRNGSGAPLSARLQEARWFMKNIQQRFDTIARVSQAIVERQKSFFTHGAIAMKPLVLREIADELGLHESTISRVTTAKYMATPMGTFELKYFFGSGLATEAGGNASSTAVRALIKQLVAAEAADQAAVGQPARRDAGRAGHPGRAAHGGQVPRSAEDRAGEPAQGDVMPLAVRRSRPGVPALAARRAPMACPACAGAEACWPRCSRCSAQRRD